MTINDWTILLHENAVKHGFWDEERPFSETVALCHSELSEALEEARSGKPMRYYNADNVDKPEGVAVEMIDCLIRILDWCGHENINVEDYISEKYRYNVTRPYKHGRQF